MGIPAITMTVNSPTLPLSLAAACVVAGLAVALPAGRWAAAWPGDLAWLAADGLGLVPALLLLRAVELPGRGLSVSPAVAWGAALGGLVVGALRQRGYERRAGRQAGDGGVSRRGGAKERSMTRPVRVLLILIAAAQLFFAAAFFFQWPPAIGLWPLEGTTPLTFILLASFFAAAAASTLWPLVTGHDGALAGVGLDYVVILAPMAAAFFLLAARGDSGLALYGVLLALGALFGAWLFWWGHRRPLDTSVPMPEPVRWSFVVFVLALLFVSVRLCLRIPTLPWPLTPELSVVAGCLFLGAAAYFIYGLLRPSWANAGGQLAGFLAYDLVLIGPLLSRLPTIAPEFRAALIVYLVVVVYSGLLAVYYLFINRETRLFSRE